MYSILAEAPSLELNFFSQFTLRFESSIYDSNLYNAKYLKHKCLDTCSECEYVKSRSTEKHEVIGPNGICILSV